MRILSFTDAGYEKLGLDKLVIMGCLGVTVHFPTTLPAAPVLVAALCEYTGETVFYDERTEFLSCPATNDGAGFEAHAHIKAHIWENPTGWYLFNPNLDGGYLWFATLMVLQRLGGTCDWQIPAWAFKPWHLAKREQKRWFVRRFTYTEARRLGVE